MLGKICFFSVCDREKPIFLGEKMMKLYKLLSVVLASSFVVAILVLALTPAPVEAKGPPTISWDVRTDSGYFAYGDLLATRQLAKTFCGVYWNKDPDQGNIIYISKEGRDHNICRFK